MIKLNGHLITPTIFPDKTSQVWKVGLHFGNDTNNVEWEFENEAEFMQLAQLKTLIDIGCVGEISHVRLSMPYLPYARQDKEISDFTTFAFYPFAHLLNSLNFAEVEIYDPHNVELTKRLINNVKIIMPYPKGLIKQAGAKQAVYPDLGAAKRYNAPKDALRCEKVREPLTGAITGLKVIGKVKHTSYVIIDDICDGGRTFIEVAKKLYEKGAKEVHLYVSHGIFSKGLEPLREAGIKRIFTRKGEVK